MAVRIRLTRVGATKRPSYRVVAIDSRRPRDGRALEILGFYDPLTDPATVNIDADRLKSWLDKGASPSDTVVKLMRQAGIGGAAVATAAAPAAQTPKRASATSRATPKPKARSKAAAVPVEAAAPATPDAPEAPETQAPRVKELLEYIARGLVEHPDAVTVEIEEEDDEEIILVLGVDERDMGRVIGRDGRIANAIRSLLRVMASRDGRHVELEIVGDED